jgi:hypothetical protein
MPNKTKKKTIIIYSDDLEKHLIEVARKEHPRTFEIPNFLPTYIEDVSPDAIRGDDWLENRTSYIWKVGVLALIDPNKCDWITLYIGTKRDEKSTPELIGTINFRGGENDDPGRTITRLARAAACAHCALEAS